MLSHIVTGDETRVSHITPESKQQFLALEAHWLAEKEKVQADVFNKEVHVHYHKEGDGMLSRIVTGDETRVSHITSESKQQFLALEAHWLAEKEKVQADVFNKEDHVHRILG